MDDGLRRYDVFRSDIDFLDCLIDPDVSQCLAISPHHFHSEARLPRHRQLDIVAPARGNFPVEVFGSALVALVLLGQGDVHFFTVD